jgi:ComF family protein
MQSLYRAFLAPVLDFIYPRICFTCSAMLAFNETRICSACWQSFLRLDRTHPTWQEIEAKLVDGDIISSLTSCFLFERDGKLQNVIHLLKYGGMKSIGVRLGREIGTKLQEQNGSGGIDYLLPVPLHRVKKRERGYNQAEILSRGIAEVTHLPIASSFIYRKKYTVSQTQLDLSRRKENVTDAFRINPKKVGEVKDKSFLIVDDVITTGSTLNACAKVLKQLGASRIEVASVALAQ